MAGCVRTFPGDVVSSIADIAVAALQADQDRLRVISQNLSNTSTPGYRAEIPALADALQFDALVQQGDSALAVAREHSLRSERAGALKQTDRKLDVALEGAGYFQLQSGDGGVAYTRRGDFHIDRNGVLLGPHDLPVLGAGGQIVLPDADVVIRADGTIEKDGNTIARRALAQFPAGTSFEYGGEGIFYSDARPIDGSDQVLHVRQGFVEAANVQPMVEMTRMLELSRHFGASAQALKAYDQMLDAAITGLGA